MTDHATAPVPVPTAARPSFGLALGQAARQLSKIHLRTLTGLGTDFPTWMLLTLLHEQDAPIPADTVAEELRRRMDLARPDTLGLLGAAAAAGLVAYRPRDPHPAAELTPHGTAYFANLYARSRAATDAAGDRVDPAALEAAVSVLIAVHHRATELLDA